MVLSRPRWRLAAIATSLLTGLTVLPSVPAAASDTSRSAHTPTVVADGLNNPRQLSWSGDALYVAESGTGGTGACIVSPEGGQSCYGASGSITRVKHGHQRRVVQGLPSIAGPTGEGAIGPSDVIVQGRRYVVSLGLGADPREREAFNARGQKLGTVATGRFGRSRLPVLADIGDYEADVNPDKKQIDTNPVALLRDGSRTKVVDAGGNSLLNVSRHGRISTLATFPTVDVQAPGAPPGTLMPMDAVPTSAVYGPDGAIYVSQLTGFPFPVGGASIWRVVPGKAPTKYATGLTNVTDLAFAKDGSLYAVQLATQGLLSGPIGSVVRIPKGGGATHTTLNGNLEAPYGIALRGHSAYVTTCSVCPGGGEVLRVPLRQRS